MGHILPLAALPRRACVMSVDRPPTASPPPNTTTHTHTQTQVATSHFLLTDMDLWPAQHTYALLRRLALLPETRPAFLDPWQVRCPLVPSFFLLWIMSSLLDCACAYTYVQKTVASACMSASSSPSNTPTPNITTQAFVAPAFGFFGPPRQGADGLMYPPDPDTVPANMVRSCVLCYTHIYPPLHPIIHPYTHIHPSTHTHTPHSLH